MLYLIVVHDDEDLREGTNFHLSYTHLSDTVKFSNYSTTILNGSCCDASRVQECITGFEERPFIFVAFSHGDCGYLTSKNYGQYVNSGNSYFFASSLFYTNACYSAGELSQALLRAKCTVFVGYRNEVRLPTDEEIDQHFIECENYAIAEFLSTDKQIGECFSEMEVLYRKQIKELEDIGDIINAGRLGLNLNALSLESNINVSRNDFFY